MTDFRPSEGDEPMTGQLTIHTGNSVDFWTRDVVPLGSQYSPVDEKSISLLNGKVQRYSPSKYIPINARGDIDLAGRIGSITDGSVDNKIELEYDDQPYGRRGYASDEANLAELAQLVMQKTYQTNGTTNQGDTLSFTLTVYNTGFTDWSGDVIVRDWIPSCLEPIAGTFNYNPTQSWTTASNDLVREFTNGNIGKVTIP